MTDTIGNQSYSEVSLTQGLPCMYIYVTQWGKSGTSRKGWIRVSIRTDHFQNIAPRWFTGGLHCILLDHEAQLCYYKDTKKLELTWTARAWVFKKGNFTSFQSVYGCLSVYRHMQCKPPLSPPLSFPTVFADFWAAFLQEHESILRNTIVYGDITVTTTM